MNLKFVISHLDQQLGPFTEQELKTRWAKGELLPIDYVYDETKKDWILMAEYFPWATGRGDTSPPPLRSNIDKKKAPPTPLLQAQTPGVTNRNMPQQKPALESTLIIQAPQLNLSAMPSPFPVIDDPLPTPTALPMMPMPMITPTAPSKPAAAMAYTEPFAPISASAPVFQVTSTPSTQTHLPLPAKVKIVNGVGELDLSPDTPGQVELFLQEASGENLKMQESLKIQVRPLEPEEIIWDFPPQQTVGLDLNISIKAVDGKGTPCPHFSGEFTVRAGAHVLAIHMNGGQATVKVSNTKAEKWAISVQYNGDRSLRLPEEKSLDWQPGPAARLLLDGPPELIAGNPLKVQVRAVDQYGNLAKAFQGTVVLEAKAS